MDTWIVTFTNGTTTTVRADDVEYDGDWVRLVDGEGRPLWAAPRVNLLHLGRAAALGEA